MGKLRVYSFFTMIVVLFVLLQGSIVTKTGSGQGCGTTWPLCFGELIPYNPTLETIIEYTHRLISSFAGMLVLVLSFWSWHKLSYIKEIKFFAALASLAIIVQGLMGAGQVVFGQPPVIMALHFGFSAVSLAAVFTIFLFTFENKLEPFKINVSIYFRRYVIAIALYSYAVIYTGAFVKHMGAATACAGFPLCDGKFVLFNDGMVVFAQMFHRISGMFLSVLVVLLFIWIVVRYRGQRLLMWIGSAGVLLVIIQLLSGVGMVLTKNQNLTIGIIHALTISILFSIYTYTIVLSRRK
ncbi:COX15/CtaA family protein [Alkalicoccobacillus plakortidis]|uniref:Heme A synthase n=1 Tax=Alkalicoccobacillus plakortidis TaxID=444060 RepID=A0ABT0XNK3_9BACI|nr:heme A synthase [Alkalicoccobacillus plakortidis]MCM2677491.1 heme A synthase [Alkalicoccobacillus plakortidis]